MSTTVDTSSTRKLLRALEQLPPPRRGSMLHARSPAGPRSSIREHPRIGPLGVRAVAGELQARTVGLLVATAALVAASALFGSRVLG